MQSLIAIPSALAREQTAAPVRRAQRGEVSIAHTSETASVRTDVELIEAFRTGDERAFAELYTRYKSEIYTFCLRMLGGNGADAGDAYQETFVKVYQKLHTFRYGENVKGWIYMIARNVSLNIYRSKRPEESIEFHVDLANTERWLSPDFAGEQRSLREAIEAAVATLPIEFREPFVLREFDGLGYPEIAKITETSIALTKVRIHRAKQRLRKLLAPIMTDETYRANGTSFATEEESE